MFLEHGIRDWNMYILYLSVTRVGDRFILIVFQSNVPERSIRDVLDVNPFHFELSLPFVLTPDGGWGLMVHSTHHLCHPTEVSRRIHRIKQVNGAFTVTLTPGVIQPLVSWNGNPSNEMDPMDAGLFGRHIPWSVLHQISYLIDRWMSSSE